MDKILFDLDNVIIDSADYHYNGVNKALKKLYDYEIPYDEHIKEYNGLPTKVKIAKLIEYGKLPVNANLKLINQLKQSYTISIINENCKPDPDKLFIMNNLATDGWTIGCVTNSIRQTTEIMLNKSGLGQFMSVVVCGDEVAKGKPDPEGYRFAREKLGAGPWDVLVIEDSPYGVEAAVGAECITYQVKDYADVNWATINNAIGMVDELRKTCRKWSIRKNI